MIAPTGRFRRSERLLQSKDYQRVARSGRRRASRCFVVLVAPARCTNPTDKPPLVRRLGMTASRKVGNAVTRNRVKRSIRAWFRERRGRLEENVDIVVIARRPAAELEPLEIYEALDRILLPQSDEKRLEKP